jgi:hypothetical protein
VEEWIVIVVSTERCNCSEERIVAEHLNNTCDYVRPTRSNVTQSRRAPSVRDRHMFRELIVIDTCVMFTNDTLLHTTARFSKFNNWIEFAPFWEMTNSCEENLQSCTRMFLRHLDFVLPSRAQFLSFGRNCFSFTT